MKTTYVKPCARTVQADVVGQMLTTSGNLSDMQRGSANIFGDVDDWDDAKQRSSEQVNEDYGDLW